MRGGTETEQVNREGWLVGLLVDSALRNLKTEDFATGQVVKGLANADSSFAEIRRAVRVSQGACLERE